MKKRPAKKPVKKAPKKAPRKAAAKKPLRPKEEFLSDELIRKLTRDGYCFNPVHEEDLKKDQDRTAALEKEVEDIKVRCKAELEAAKEALDEEVKDRANRLFELEGQKEALEEELRKAREEIDRMKSDANLAKTEAIKELKAEGKCFDIMHRSVDGMKTTFVSPVVLASFGVGLITNDVVIGRVAVSYPKSAEGTFQRALKMEERVDTAAREVLKDVFRKFTSD